MAKVANEAMLKKVSDTVGFIAALDQSGGSTPKALLQYGIDESAYSNDEEMFATVHATSQARPSPARKYEASFCLKTLWTEKSQTK